MNLGDRMKEADQRNALLARIERSLTNVTPTMEGIRKIERIRDLGKLLGGAIVADCPLSREQSLALTHVEEAVMWAVKSIVLDNDDG